MTKEIITELDRKSFLELLTNNPGRIIIKFTAEWCGPCKKIKTYVDKKFNEQPDNVICVELDIDHNFDIYAFMKSKKMVQGIPTLLCYKPENNSYPPAFSISGSNIDNIERFFKMCET